MNLNKIHTGDALTVLSTIESNSVDCCVTSPPYYGLRDYGNAGQLGLEETPELYVANMVQVFEQVRRVLKPEGTLWLNLGDSYASSSKGSGGTSSFQHLTNKGSRYDVRKFKHGMKEKDLIGIPWMVAFALRSAGWYLRQDIIWHKPNPMPESVTDRCTKAHEYIFLLSKSAKYYYDADSISEEAVKGSAANAGERNYRGIKGRIKAGQSEQLVEDGRNKRSVWTVTTKGYNEAHFATFPQDLIVDMIKAGCPENGTVLDCFMGAGTTALVARKLNRNYIGIELNPAYVRLANIRLRKELGMFI